MIVREKPGPLQLLLAMRGSVLPRVAPRVVIFTGLAAALVAVDRFFMHLPGTQTAPFAVFGIALSLFLGFRNNAAYDRWWEGRRLWGQLISDTRSLGREVQIFIPAPEDRIRILRLSLAFLHAHRINLRQLKADAALATWADAAIADAPHPPCAALDRMAAVIAEAAPDGFARKALTERMAMITQAQAGCERIATTPLPFVYSLLIFRTTYLYCAFLAFALPGSAGWLSPVFVGIVAYVFFGLAEVTEELAHPFGETVNGLPLDAMCRTAEISIAPHLGLPVPQPMKADRYYLS